MITNGNYIYYTIEEATELLPNKPTPEWVLKQIYDPDPPEINKYAGLYIIPSFYAEHPILVLRESSTEPEKITGWFDIEGIEKCCEFKAETEDEENDKVNHPNYVSDPVCNEEICFEAHAKYPYLQRSIGRNCLDSNAGICVDYCLLETLKVSLDKLFIRDDEIKHFKDHYDTSGINSKSESTEYNDRINAIAKDLKKIQTAEIDAKIDDICSNIKVKAIEHMSNSRKERVVNHTRFIDEAEIAPGKNRDRALKLVKEYLSNCQGDLKYHGFKYANKPVKQGKPYFLTDEEGLKAEN